MPKEQRKEYRAIINQEGLEIDDNQMQIETLESN